MTKRSDLPAALPKPAQRALAAAGCTRLTQVAKLTEAEVKAMHGVGGNAVEKLRAALREEGLSFAKRGA
jgi:hypothetical protein